MLRTTSISPFLLFLSLLPVSQSRNFSVSQSDSLFIFQSLNLPVSQSLNLSAFQSPSLSVSQSSSFPISRSPSFPVSHSLLILWNVHERITKRGVTGYSISILLSVVCTWLDRVEVENDGAPAAR